jgi:hypothetical protein
VSASKCLQLLLTLLGGLHCCVLRGLCCADYVVPVEALLCCCSLQVRHSTQRKSSARQ